MSKEGAVVILEDRSGRIAMQLRDDRPKVVSAGQWGLFGGWIEPDELPRDTVIREVQEELNFTLQSTKLSFLEARQIAWGVSPDIFTMSTHVFHYPVTGGLDLAVLSEGQAFQFMQLSDLTYQKVGPHHRVILNDYWRTK